MLIVGGRDSFIIALAKFYIVKIIRQKEKPAKNYSSKKNEVQ